MPLIAPVPISPINPLKTGDVVVPDKKVKLSTLVAENGRTWPVRETVAVILAESSGDPKARNWCCTGLMQVHYVHAGSLGLGEPKERAAFRDWLEDPRNNIAAGYVIWQRAGGTFAKDWEVWQTGRYKRFMGQDKEVTTDKRSVATAARDAADAALGPLDEIASALLSPDTWFRIGKGYMGVMLITTGTTVLLFIGARKLGAAPPVKKVAKTVVTKKLPV